MMLPAPKDRLHELAFAYADAVKASDEAGERYRVLCAIGTTMEIVEAFQSSLAADRAEEKAERALLAEARTR